MIFQFRAIFIKVIKKLELEAHDNCLSVVFIFKSLDSAIVVFDNPDGNDIFDVSDVGAAAGGIGALSF